MKPYVLQSFLVATCLIATVATAPGAPTPHQPGSRGIDRRGDIRNVPGPLKDRLVELARRPHTYPPLTIFSEAPTPSQLFGYFLLDSTGFEPNVFTTTIVGINDGVAPTATGANHDTPTLGSVRLALEPKPGLPTDPNDPGSFIDIFTDIYAALRHQQRVGLVRGLDDPRRRRARRRPRCAATARRSSG